MDPTLTFRGQKTWKRWSEANKNEAEAILEEVEGFDEVPPDEEHGAEAEHGDDAGAAGDALVRDLRGLSR